MYSSLLLSIPFGFRLFVFLSSLNFNSLKSFCSRVTGSGSYPRKAVFLYTLDENIPSSMVLHGPIKFDPADLPRFRSLNLLKASCSPPTDWS